MSDAVNPVTTPARAPRGRLFVKYVGVLMAVVAAALIASGGLEIWFSYKESREFLVRIQREQADAAATKIGQFVKEIEGQLGWTTQLPWSAATLEQRRFDALRLLRQVPAVTELAQLDARGIEQLRVSRLAMDVVSAGTDLSREPRFVEAVARKVHYGPVYFRRESEPYMTLAVAGNRRDAGVSVAEVNLKFIWDVVSQIKVGKGGAAYVIDGGGRLIAHPDISLVLRNTDLARLAQVADAIAGKASNPDSPVVDVLGREVLTAHAAVAGLGWFVFVELPLAEALAPIYASIQRTGVLLLLGLAIALGSGILLTRRLVGPIRALRVGAAEIGAGALDRRIDVRTGDELEALGHQFNDMAARLQESYRGLEHKVEERTRELSEALERQTATSEVLNVISRSTSQLQPVLDAICDIVIRLLRTDHCFVFLFRDGLSTLAAARGGNPEFIEYLRANPIAPGPNTLVGRITREKRPAYVRDALNDPNYGWKEAARIGNYRSTFGVPMLRQGEVIGAIVLTDPTERAFSDAQVDLLAGFAEQAVIAIENVRLFDEVQARTRELARSVDELRALGEVSQAINSTLDAPTVLQTIVAKSVEISGTDAGAIYVWSNRRGAFRMRASAGGSVELDAAMRRQTLAMDSPLGEAAKRREPVQIPELREVPETAATRLLIDAGYRALLIVPLIGPERAIGTLVLRRKQTGSFAARTVDLMRTFATQSVIAIQNARLFGEIQDKSHELELASQHKSQFLANMSHELRTPLNAILGYTELIVDGIYGETPEKVRGVLDRVQSNGRHLLGLINDVLDLSKIEAGQLTLAIEPYAMATIMQSVASSTESLARTKGLALKLSVSDGLPLGAGDERRLTQVVLNLVGNAIKFTDAGHVELAARASGEKFIVTVRDTGPGIAPENQARIFEEFQQVDSSSTRKKGGSGLGLAISRRIIELHGGTIGVESQLGTGSTFIVTIPIRAHSKNEAAP